MRMLPKPVDVGASNRLHAFLVGHGSRDLPLGHMRAAQQEVLKLAFSRLPRTADFAGRHQSFFEEVKALSQRDAEDFADPLRAPNRFQSLVMYRSRSLLVSSDAMLSYRLRGFIRI
jgi:hypothetical protein